MKKKEKSKMENTANKRERTCKERINQEYKDLIRTMRAFQEHGWCNDYDQEGHDSDLGPFNEYGLSYDYVAPGTFEGQREGYFRYQLSWGGPSDEIRFFASPGRNGYNWKLYRIQYHFMDWFDGAKKVIREGKNYDLLAELFEQFNETGTVQHVFEQAMKE